MELWHAELWGTRIASAKCRSPSCRPQSLLYMPSFATKKAAITAMLLVGTLAMPARSQSESFNYDYYCSMGSFMVCASVRIQSVDNVLTMQVWNLNGTEGVQHTITEIGLYHASYDWTGTVNSAVISYLTSSGSTNISQ